MNISAKYHQNRSIQFQAIPFQSWVVFWDTVYKSNNFNANVTFWHWSPTRYLITSDVYNHKLSKDCLVWWVASDWGQCCWHREKGIMKSTALRLSSYSSNVDDSVYTIKRQANSRTTLQTHWSAMCVYLVFTDKHASRHSEVLHAKTKVTVRRQCCEAIDCEPRVVTNVWSSDGVSLWMFRLPHHSTASNHTRCQGQQPKWLNNTNTHHQESIYTQNIGSSCLLNSQSISVITF